jgi:membrane peptidoglycan carboxypeptidase
MTTTPDTKPRSRGRDDDGTGDEPARRRGPIRWWKDLSRRAKSGIVAIFLVPIMLVVVAAGIFYAEVKVPTPQTIQTAEISSVTYRDGKTEIMKIGTINRTNVPLSKVSLAAQHAVLAAEDKDFYSESGISYSGIARALWADLRGREITQGGSTITQQYAKNAFLSSERSFTRKLKEIVIAIKLDKKYSKDQILEYYLNTIYFGRGSYGIQAAAQTYFGIPASRLTAGQGALLAGLIRAPSLLDPRVNPKSAQTRFLQVVDAMAAKGWVEPGQASTSKMPATRPLSTTGPNGPKSAQDAYIREEVMRELKDQGITEDEIMRGGLQITTTLDKTAQTAALNAVAASFTFTPPDVQPALVAIQPGTGEVRAWYGGRFYGKSPSGFTDYVDNVRDPVQPGSSFKPIALAAALEHGISLNSFYNGNSGQVVTEDYKVGGDPGPVPNFAGESLGQINLLTATALSINSVFVPLAIDAGKKNVIDMAHALGIPNSEKLTERDSLPLGVDATSPLAMTDVYATFAAQGMQAPAHLVAKVVDRDGNVRYTASTKAKRVMTVNAAADQTFALQQPFAYGTAAGLSPGRPVAGKTGTTDKNVSAWLCGYAPQLAACVAVSRANHQQSLNGIFNNATEATGASTAGRTWQAFMTEALAGQPVIPFPNAAFGGSTPTGHASPTPPPPKKTAKPSPKPSPSESASPSEPAAPSQEPEPSQAPEPTASPSGTGLLGGVLGGGGEQTQPPPDQGDQGSGPPP